MSSQSSEELLKAVEACHEQYLRSLRSLHDSLAGTVRERSDSRTSVTLQPSPLLRPSHSPVQSPVQSPILSPEATFQPTLRRARRSTLSDPIEKRPIHVTERKHVPSSIHSELDVEYLPLLDVPIHRVASDGSFTSPSPRLIERVSWTDPQLLHHLKHFDFTGGVAIALADVIKKQTEIDENADFESFAAYESQGYISSTFELYDVDTEGCPRPVGKQPDQPPRGNGTTSAQSQIADAPTVWNALKGIHADGKAVGLVTILQEPTALMLGALHMTMAPYFDMTELFNHLITDHDNNGKTTAYVHRAFAKDSSPRHIRQRSFFFAFKYYTVVGEGLEPAPWQKYDNRPPDRRSPDHIDIAECSSILALSLSGQPRQSVKQNRRREGTQEGFLFDTFAPWHLLSIQSFPDDEHTLRGSEAEARKTFLSGPYAFMDALVTEYRDATKRNATLHARIAKLITPPTDFMFDGRLRDKLLFEDKHFTYIRRYFWAYNTLGVVNEGLRAMLAAYYDNFPDDFWEGRHPTLWPHPTPESPEGRAYRDKMAPLRLDLERACRDLETVHAKNVATRKEIENLRDQLFSGSSIKESRRAIEQGDNIKVLTLGSMVFLPLTFVTSVFGITEFDIPPQNWRFAVTMVCVCVPFILALILLQTRAGYSLAKHTFAAITWPFRYFMDTGAEEKALPTVTMPAVEVKPRRKRRLTRRWQPQQPPREGLGTTQGLWMNWRPWQSDGVVNEVSIDKRDVGKDNEKAFANV
ncbi:GTPase-activator protein for ras-like GTPase containing protein [Colletotrichum truncatum]|uniref:GTPase-activator protein for ras-like GTPase containing protein n=1 Tax=Colletotrichum truncatum TaxID=5467 RepID=A0ACC3Z633_COLTU|nr:GTPase-activator protein for ras-like GTPase containing protein [Colletotrichum truncatum]KAF6787147.1 GTPase-activator protein for ras-like GTPase containing protein [Colletotrichum truncatum]